MERFAPRQPYDDNDDFEFDTGDEEQYDTACVKHKHAIRRLQHAHHEVGPCSVAHASQHDTRPCPCGRGVLARWPWVAQTAQMGFCDCGMAGWERTCWRSEWIGAGAPDLAWCSVVTDH